MKRVLLFCLFLSFGLICFGQELTVTSVVSDGKWMSDIDGGGNWPNDLQVGPRWNSLFKKYNLVRLENDPFNPNQFIGRIGEMAAGKTDGFPGGAAYSVYFTMGDRRFICFIYYGVLAIRQYWCWVYEVK